MSAYKQAEIDLQKFFRDAWVAAGQSESIICWMNEKFDRPSNSTWIRFTVLGAGAQRIEIGTGGKNLYPGIVDIEIYAPRDDKGLATLYTYVDVITAIFEDQVVTSKTHFDKHDLSNLMAAEDGWLKVNVSFPFQRYE